MPLKPTDERFDRLKNELCDKCKRRFVDGYFYARPHDVDWSLFRELRILPPESLDDLFWLCPCGQNALVIFDSPPYRITPHGYRLVWLGPIPTVREFLLGSDPYKA